MIAAEIHGELPASRIAADAIILDHRAQVGEVLTGFGARYATPRPPLTVGVVVRLSIDDVELGRMTLPYLPAPAAEHTAAGRSAEPFDVAREWRQRLSPAVHLTSGQRVIMSVVSAPLDAPALAGVVQFAGQVDAGTLRAPWRETRMAGPVCSIPWSVAEEVCRGSERGGDARCSPQNNSGVVSDPDCTLWQFTAFYSEDEQFGGGRAGSISRIAAFRRADDGTWSDQGIVADPVPWGLTYAGDPFAFHDRDGTPCLASSVVDGSHGFSDWSHIGLVILRSRSTSFAGPWDPPHFLLRGLPGHGHDDRAICWRLLPRPDGSWLTCWNHGERDITWRALVLPDLRHEQPHHAVMGATIMARNQEEGGGGFADGGTAFLSSWQIPGINDPTGVQRLYAVDLVAPLEPGSWRIVPGSVGWTDPTDPRQDGGPTADAWNLSLPRSGELWATAVMWSASEQRNRILARHTRWPLQRGPWRIGVPARSWQSHGTHDRVLPCIEWALGRQWTAEVVLSIAQPGAEVSIGVSPATAPHGEGGAFFPLSAPVGQTLTVHLQRDGSTLTAHVDHIAQPQLCLDTTLAGETRLALSLGQGASVSIMQVMLDDRP